jgi:DNA-binding transcriptional ArsR family regulator
MLAGLLDGRALTATELAFAGDVSPQTASGHLARLTEGRLLTPAKQRRHVYYRLASATIGRMLEGIMAVAGDGPPRYQPRWRGGDALGNARTCYDHLAGRLGVGLADALVARDHAVLSEDSGIVTGAGEEFLRGFGIELQDAGKTRRAFCRPCLDWSERRTYLAGGLGAALATSRFELDRISRMRDSRAVLVTEKCKYGSSETFGVALVA